MSWNGVVYIDAALPFGLRSAPNIFTAVGDALAWVLKAQGVTWLLKYIDDILTIGPPGSSTCAHNLDIIIQVCDMLGVPLAREKVEGPSTCLPFLGIELDTCLMEMRLPQEKLERLKATVAEGNSGRMDPQEGSNQTSTPITNWSACPCSKCCNPRQDISTPHD